MLLMVALSRLTPAHIGHSDHAGFQQYMLTDDYAAAGVRKTCPYVVRFKLTSDLTDSGGNLFRPGGHPSCGDLYLRRVALP